MHSFPMRYSELSVIERFLLFKVFVIRGSIVCTVGPLNKGHFWNDVNFGYFCSLYTEVCLFCRIKMYCWNYTGTISCVLCREVYCTVSLFGRVHYQRFHCIMFICAYVF